MLFSRGSSWPRDRTQASHIASRFFTIWATREAQEYWSGSLSLLQGIFPAQELNQGLLHCRWILSQLSYQGSPYMYIITHICVWQFSKLSKIKLNIRILVKSWVIKSLMFPHTISLVTQMVKNLPAMQETWVWSLGLIPGLRISPWRRAWQPSPVFLPGESPWTEEPGRL